jgi:hypothetical protein
LESFSSDVCSQGKERARIDGLETDLSDGPCPSRERKSGPLKPCQAQTCDLIAQLGAQFRLDRTRNRMTIPNAVNRC